MKVKLKAYLAQIEHEESFKPNVERREVPTITDLAKEVGVSRAQLHRLLASDVKSLKLELIDDIMGALVKRGFEPRLEDVLEYRRPASEQGN